MTKSYKINISIACAVLLVFSVFTLIAVPGIVSDAIPKPTMPETIPSAPNPGVPNHKVEYAEHPADFWADCPDGIRIEKIAKQNCIINVMYIRDPSQVYLATSSDSFSLDKPGNRLLHQLRAEGAIAGMNAGAFNDDGTAENYVGSLPVGMVVSEGEILWDDGESYRGFVGMTEDNKLYVSDTIDRAAVEEMKIRDGCCFGPALIKDGELLTDIKFGPDNYNSRSVIGQRADGTVLFVCIDGRQAGSIGARYTQLQGFMAELGAVNACTLDGGASTVMAYRDSDGRYGKKGEVIMVNSYSLLQANPRRMPTFFMVRSGGEG